MQKYSLRKGFLKTGLKAIANQTVTKITAILVLTVLVTISAIAIWNWLWPGSPESGWLEKAPSVIGSVSVLFVAAPLGVALWRTVLTQRQIDLTSQNARYERFQRGIEMLGSAELFVRLGGIYALRTLMKEYSEELHVPIMELLCAFLRNPIDADEVTRGSSVRQDIQTALDVIVRRGETEVILERARGFRLDLRNANFQYANLPGVDLSGSNLEGTVLSYTNMNGANFSRAKFEGADLSFANCRNCNFTGVLFILANMHHVAADGSDFSKARIDWVDCTEGSFHKSKFTKAEISSCDFTEALLYETDLTRTHLGIGTKFTQEQLDKAASEPRNPPIIDPSLVDPETAAPFKWQGELTLAGKVQQSMIEQDKLKPPKSGGRDLHLKSVSMINLKPPSKRQRGYF